MQTIQSDNPLKVAIEKQIVSDQGTAFRKWSEYYLPTMEDAYRASEDDGLRTHLGASLIGNSCARQLFYSFRWFKSSVHGARLLRLFNRGHLEEARFLAMLSAVGVEIYPHHPETGKQFRIKGCDGHYGGALDGIGRFVPGLGDQWANFEMKTHGEKSFKSIKAKGVKASKPVHYVQMQQGMGFYHLNYCVYMAVNKNTDELYVEFIPFDEVNYRRYTDRPAHIIQTSEAPTVPPRMQNASPSWFECKFCDFSDICFDETNDTENIRFGCRTCVYSRPVAGGKWYCALHNQELSKEFQLAGCDQWTLIKG